jgi:hypothetical protein
VALLASQLMVSRLSSPLKRSVSLLSLLFLCFSRLTLRLQIAIAVASGQCIHSLCNALTVMEREGRYADYVEVISKLLLPGVRTEVPRSEVLERQWRQLLAVGHVFALNYIEEGRFGPALAMLKRVEQLLSEDMMMDVRIAREIKAFVDDGYSYYYYSRGK